MTKKPPKLYIDPSRTARASVSAPKEQALYVMLAAADKERFEKAAKASGLTMRDFVRQACELLTNSMDAATSPAMTIENVATGELDPETTVRQTLDWHSRRLNSHALRLETVERELAALKRRVDLEWGPDALPASLPRKG